MKQYTPTIGLEIHIELKTRTKMFCGCLNDSNEKTPNKNVCPVCLAHPGALPTINAEAVESVVKLGLALNGSIADHSHFDRKSYFYPDLPKGYQISQYENPLIKGGSLNNIRVRRIHLEEDTGRLLHGHKSKSSSIDYNRAGVPLMELVTEPDIKNGETAMKFAKSLHLILRYLNIANADMEKGEMRIEANISVSDTENLGTKVEVKNLNSFASVGAAIDYEIKRQADLLKRGEDIKQETRGWDEILQETKLQRAKEEAHDYRYFPEPDLPEMDLTKPEFIDINKLKIELPEMPVAKIERFQKEYALNPNQTLTIVNVPEAARFFEEAVSELKTETDAKNFQIIFNYLCSDIFGLMKNQNIGFEELKISPENLADLVTLIIRGEISSRIAKDLLLKMQETGDDPKNLISKLDIKHISDETSIRNIIKIVIDENPKALADYQEGNLNAVQFLIGKTMAKMKGQGDPNTIAIVLNQELENRSS